VPHTLLLADDSVTIQRVIELTFADEDVTVIAVSDGDQAIERLEASPPDIVLADIGMPGKNGYEVAQYIRQSPKLSHIPVLLLTGAFEPVDQARANEAGCDGVLAKPFEPQLVISRVKELLARGRRDPEARDAEIHTVGLALAQLAAPASDSILAPPPLEQPFVTPFIEQPVAATPTGPVPRTELNDYFDRLDAAFSTLSSNPPGQHPTPAKPIADPPPVAIDTDIDWFGTKTAEGGNAEPWDLPAPPSETEPVDLPLSYASPQPEASFAPLQPSASFAPVAEVEPVAEVAPVALTEEPVAPAQEVAAPEPEVASAQPEPAAAPAAPLAPVAPAAPVASGVPALELPLPNPPPLPALADAFAALLAAEHGAPQSAAAGTWPASLPSAAAVSDELIENVTRRVLERLSDTSVREAVADIASKVAERLIREEIERIKASIK
jgi:CheY-like chemotaxis protein